MNWFVLSLTLKAQNDYNQSYNWTPLKAIRKHFVCWEIPSRLTETKCKNNFRLLKCESGTRN